MGEPFKAVSHGADDMRTELHADSGRVEGLTGCRVARSLSISAYGEMLSSRIRPTIGTNAPLSPVIEACLPKSIFVFESRQAAALAFQKL